MLIASILFLILLSLSYSMDLNTALQKALANHPSIKALEEELKGLDGKAITYRSYLNPTLGVEFGNFGTSVESYKKNPIYRFSYSQPFFLYPVGELSKRAVSFEKLALKEKIEEQKNLVKSETYRAFYKALYYKELLKISKENYQISEGIYNFIKKLFELGETTKLELFRAERELKLAKIDLDLAQKDYESALSELSFWVGEKVEDVEGSLEELREIKPLDLESLPQLRYYQNSIKGIMASVELERALAKPQTSVEVFGEKVSDSSYGFRVALSSTLPLFYRREGEILELLAKKESLEKQKSLEEMRIKSELESLSLKYEALKDSIKEVEKVLNTAREELSLAIKSYRLKTITALELSDTKRRYLELLKYRAELLLKAHEEFGKYLLLGGSL